jgi:hypothetical protein
MRVICVDSMNVVWTRAAIYDYIMCKQELHDQAGHRMNSSQTLSKAAMIVDMAAAPTRGIHASRLAT